MGPLMTVIIFTFINQIFCWILKKYPHICKTCCFAIHWDRAFGIFFIISFFIYFFRILICHSSGLFPGPFISHAESTLLDWIHSKGWIIIVALNMLKTDPLFTFLWPFWQLTFCWIRFSNIPYKNSSSFYKNMCFLGVWNFLIKSLMSYLYFGIYLPWQDSDEGFSGLGQLKFYFVDAGNFPSYCMDYICI